MYAKKENKIKKTLQQLEEEKNQKLNMEQNKEQNEQSIINSENLLSYISMWDFSKVQKAIKQQIQIDKWKYNEDISNSLESLDKAVKTFTKANDDLLLVLTSIGDLISFTKGKDYFINWFNDIKFEISDSNSSKVLSNLDLLSKLFWKKAILDLLSKLSNSLWSSGQEVVEKNIKKFDNFWDDEEPKLFNIKEGFSEEPVSEKDSTLEDNNDKVSFDISSNFESFEDFSDNNVEVYEKDWDNSEIIENEKINIWSKDYILETVNDINESDSSNSNKSNLKSKNIQVDTINKSYFNTFESIADDFKEKIEDNSNNEKYTENNADEVERADVFKMVV